MMLVTDHDRNYTFIGQCLEFQLLKFTKNLFSNIWKIKPEHNYESYWYTNQLL